MLPGTSEPENENLSTTEPANRNLRTHAPANLSTLVSSVFAEGGPLARAFSAFEPREGQRTMAEAVAAEAGAFAYSM